MSDNDKIFIVCMESLEILTLPAIQILFGSCDPQVLAQFFQKSS